MPINEEELLRRIARLERRVKGLECLEGGGAAGAATTWTPTVKQNGSTVTLNSGASEALYADLGYAVWCYMNVVVSSFGGSSGKIEVTGLPVTPRTSPSAAYCVGIWRFRRSTTYGGPVIMNADGSGVYFRQDNSTSDFWTGTTVASGDELNFILLYPK